MSFGRWNAHCDACLTPTHEEQLVMGGRDDLIGRMLWYCVTCRDEGRQPAYRRYLRAQGRLGGWK